MEGFLELLLIEKVNIINVVFLELLEEYRLLILLEFFFMEVNIILEILYVGE